jgi:two-component system nitrogen regulation response regulator GlnG
MNKVWIIDDDQGMRWVVEQAMQQANIPTKTFSLATDALKELDNSRPAVVVSDIRMPETDGISFMQSVHQKHPELPVIIMTAHSDLDSAVQAYQGGAFEYLPKPFDMDEAVTLVQRALETVTQSDIESAGDIPALVGSSIPMQEIFRNIGRLSRTSISVLITGESGTGKELIANAVHENSPRKDHPFIAINTAAIPNELLESELFGHEKGAFTGANEKRQGRFEQANHGTLFLDEIGDMPMALQTRLLRVLAEGEFYRVGGNTPVKVDVRIIAATNQDLLEQVNKNEFREDLYHRLNVYHIELPALRDRREDIPQLMSHHLLKAAEELEMPGKTLSKKAQERLQNYNWPGNVRELVNLSQRLTISAAGQQIQAADLKLESSKEASDTDWKMHIRNFAQQAFIKGEKDVLNSLIPQVEKIMLEEALIISNGHKQNAAKLLGWGRNTLTRKLKELE